MIKSADTSEWQKETPSSTKNNMRLIRMSAGDGPKCIQLIKVAFNGWPAKLIQTLSWSVFIYQRAGSITPATAKIHSYCVGFSAIFAVNPIRIIVTS